MTAELPGWDSVYTADAPPPWDIGRPQPAFARLADEGLLAGQLLDSGCGTGEHTLLAAGHGADAVGVDLSPSAIGKARAKAARRNLSARFVVGDVLELGKLGLSFDTVVDSGVFHVFDDAGRARYVASIASVLRAGGSCYLLCFSDRQPGTMGPRRIRREEITAAFASGWEIAGITAGKFHIVHDGQPATAEAWLAVLRRV